MIILQSKDVFEKLVTLDPKSNRLRWFTKEPGKHYLIQGIVTEVDGHLCFLYRENDLLHCRVDAIDFVLDEEVSVLLKPIKGKNKQFCVYRTGIEMFSLKYEVPIIKPALDIDPTPFAEEEDYDFFLFVFNVVNNKHRWETIYRL